VIDLRKIAEMYDSLADQAKRLPMLFNKMLLQSEQLIEETETTRRQFWKAATSDSKKKTGQVLEKAANHIDNSAEIFRQLRDGIAEAGEVNKQIQKIRSVISDEISA